MTIQTIQEFLLWCLLINWGLLLLWFLTFTFAHNWIYRFHGKWFKISVEQFDSIHYAGMAIYKIAIIVFVLVPYIVLMIVKK